MRLFVPSGTVDSKPGRTTRKARLLAFCPRSTELPEDSGKDWIRGDLVVVDSGAADEWHRTCEAKGFVKIPVAVITDDGWIAHADAWLDPDDLLGVTS